MNDGEHLSSRYPHSVDNLNSRAFPDEYEAYHFLIASKILSFYLDLEPAFYREFPERDLVIGWLSEKRDGLSEKREGNLTLKDLERQIRDSKQIGQYFLLAFIATDIHEQSITHDKNLFYKYKSLTVAVVFQLILSGTHESAYHKVCDEMRLFAQGKRTDLMRYLPEIREQYLSDLNEELTEQREKASDQNLSSIVDQISKYLVPYDAVASGKDEILRPPSKKREKGKFSLYPKKVLDVDTQGNTITEISEQSKQGKRSITWEREEKDSSPLDVKILSVELKHQTKEPVANHLLAKSISQHIALGKMKMPTQVSVLTALCLEVVVKRCLEDIDNPGAQLILLIMATGLPPEELAQIKFRKKAGLVSFYRDHKLPSYEQTPEFRKFIPDVSQKILLTLPECLSLPTAASIYDAIPAAKVIISTLNKTHKLNLTMGRLKLNLRTWLTRKSVDSAVIGVLCGDAPRQQAGMYYTLIDETSVFSVYKRYIAEIFSEEMASRMPESSEKYIGSNLPVLAQVISHRLAEIKTAYQQLKDPIQKHYFLAIYTYYIVALFSGYRPVSAMLGYFQDINLMTGSYTISDKENRSGISARTIILPEIAKRQISVYKQSIERFCETYNYKYPKCSERCCLALRSKDAAPWLFFEFDGEIVEPNPGELNIHLRKFFPMASNWHRHWARSTLRNFALGQDMTDGWIGHADLEQEGFGRYSALGFADFKKVAAHFDKEAGKMGLTVIDE